MKPRYLSVACIITAFSMMILMAALPLIAPQQAHASPASLPENVHLVEEGIVANPEVLEQDITQLNADDSDDILWEGYLSGELQLSPTWQNPAYATAVSTYAAGGNIVKTACTSTNYNNSDYCYAFTSLRVYRAIKLNQ